MPTFSNLFSHYTHMVLHQNILFHHISMVLDEQRHQTLGTGGVAHEGMAKELRRVRPVDGVLDEAEG